MTAPASKPRARRAKRRKVRPDRASVAADVVSVVTALDPKSALRWRHYDRERIRITALQLAMQAFPEAGRDILPDAKVFEGFLVTGRYEALDMAIQFLQRGGFPCPPAEFTAKQAVQKANAFDRYLKAGA